MSGLRAEGEVDAVEAPDDGIMDEIVHYIQTTEDGPVQEMGDEGVQALIRSHTSFVDYAYADTHERGMSLAKKRGPMPSIPLKAQQQGLIKPLLDEMMNDHLMRTVLPLLSRFHNRYYNSPSGSAASQWLLKAVSSVVDSGRPDKRRLTTVLQFSHPWKQASIIVRVDPSGDLGGRGEETVILGAHLDSINLKDPMKGRAPGSDDNGSGVVMLMEILRCLLQSDAVLDRTVEFHWYAAEEVGLLGSQAIAQSYVASHRKVAGILVVDMVATPLPTRTPTIGVGIDHVNGMLTSLVSSIILTYTDAEVRTLRCGYACSDHFAWSQRSFPASILSESNTSTGNTAVHTSADEMGRVDFTNVIRFARLGLAFILEMAILAPHP